MQDIDKPTSFETHLVCRLLVYLRAVKIVVNASLNQFPVLRAELRDTILIGIKVIRLVLMRHLKDLMCGVPVLAYANKVVDIEVYSWNVLTVEKAWLIQTLFLLLEQRESPT